MKEITTQKKRIFGRFCGVICVAVLLLCIVLPARAQYESFFGGGSWEYNVDYLMTCYTDEYNPNVFNACCNTESFLFHNYDTITIGNLCYYYYRPSFYDEIEFVCLREDSVNGRLYVRYDTAETAEEYLMCDLSLSVGDTFVIPGHILCFCGDKTMVVDSITLVSGKKVIHLTLQEEGDFFFETFNLPWMEEYNITLRFMEGVGPIFGMVPTSVFSLENGLSLLLCMYKDDMLYYMTHEDLGCEQNGSDVPEHPQSYLNVFPNPATSQITLEFITEEDISGNIILRDVVGRVCLIFAVTEKNVSLDISVLTQGVYLLTYVDDKGRKLTNKFVKE